MSDNNTYETETIAVLAGGGILLLFTAYLTHIYSDPSNYWTYTSAVYISWFLGFSGIILLFENSRELKLYNVTRKIEI